MRYAIIAAGEGSRLSTEGVAVPKPLVEVGGEALIDRLLRLFISDGASEICLVCRPDERVERHLQQWQQLHTEVRLQYVMRTTPSSMHSLFELVPMLEDDTCFLLTTVDTVFRESEFAAFMAAFRDTMDRGAADGLMGVTDYIDDEKPLYVKTGEHLNIQAFLDSDEHPHYISGGIYGLSSRSLSTLRACLERGESRMRNFQRAMLSDGLRLCAWPFTKVLDIDHVADIMKAEEFLRK